MKIAYRPEIDGLRAIAVSSVVLFHAGIGEAGFVGVDIFFVISGYLITALLLREREVTGRIDLMAFYARRVRRILPAAASVVLAVLAVATPMLSQAEVRDLGYSAIATMLFGVNFYFQHTTGGYFDGPSDALPLLHMWSLSVEEQFYLLWPALLILVVNWRAKYLRIDLLILALASFALAEFLMAYDPTAAFYSTPARLWELAVGGLIATMPVRQLPSWAAWAGLTLTAFACVFSMSHFPGYGALPAVAGAGLLIAAIHGGATNRFLASRPMVGMGLISYSLYLWHWPLLAYYRATSVGHGSDAIRLWLCAAAVLIATGSYYFIEKPFRRASKLRRPFLLGGSIVATACLSAYALIYSASQDSALVAPAFRESPVALFAESDRVPNFAACHRYQYAKPGPACQSASGQPTMAIWGDSFSLSWQPVAWHLASNTVAVTYSTDSCPPLVGFNLDKINENRGCLAYNQATSQSLARFDTVILAAYWPHYAPGMTAVIRRAQREAIRAGLRRSLAAVAPSVRQVIIIAPTPVMQDSIPHCIRIGADCGISRAQHDLATGEIRAMLNAEAKRFTNVSILDPTPFLCSAQWCPGVRDGVVLYLDEAHVTYTTARAFANQLSDVDRRLGK